MKLYLLIAISYLLGSIPTGYIIGKVFYKDDVRKYGSGNIGMSNVFRTFGPLPALFTFLVDALKGYLPVTLAIWWHFNSYQVSIIAFFAILGHIFSIYLKFKGGKGIATTFGILFAINFWIGLLVGIVWILTLFITKYVSLGSLFATFSSILFSIIFKIDISYTYLFIIIFLLSLYTHRGNIRRLIQGKEIRFGQKVRQ